MKIAYLIHWNEGPESGVYKKVANQMSEWKKLGHDVTLFLFTHNDRHEWSSASSGIPVVVQTYRGFRKRFSEFRKLVKAVEAWMPDVIYHRFDLYYYSLPYLLKKFPSVLEINTNDLTEMRLEMNFRYYYHLWTRGKVLAAAAGFVFVSGELAEERHFKRYVKDRIVIGNGIHLDSVKPVRPADNEYPRFVFIGSSGQSWHGVDVIAELAAVRPLWQFDLIGVNRAELPEPVPANMAFHGTMTKEHYQGLMDRADIALGTLALYRKQMDEASPLKVREYLANGLPVIIGYRETDFPDAAAAPFILELPNKPGSISAAMGKIEDFVRIWTGKRVNREAIRHLDTGVKEVIRVDYMRHISEKGERT
ncbi:glycosyltransferase [Paenibacillus glycinis]|uniref:Glycosyltransferase n=1 Tax=Paenibacillus glycinis TaxID=2697035 RepID=A0ABW9XNK5_9BACL|nr:glycosyltransferase [Paenibacillus glycinis]NBD24204.1 glycosyltransferase [Paenibacillus glycinis]